MKPVTPPVSSLAGTEYDAGSGCLRADDQWSAAIPGSGQSEHVTAFTLPSPRKGQRQKVRETGKHAGVPWPDSCHLQTGSPALSHPHFPYQLGILLTVHFFAFIVLFANVALK